MSRRAVVVLCWLLSVVPALAHAADGDLDASFGTGGMVADPYPETSANVAMALRSDGKIMLAELEGGDLQLLRYDGSGMLDPTFGTGGILTQPAPGSALSGLVVMPNGDLVVLAHGNAGAFVLARYDAAGSPVASFGAGGVAPLPDCGAELDAYAGMVVTSDGKLVVGISSYDPTPSYDACVVRVDASGAVDPEFGTGGVVTLPNWIVAAVALQGDRVLVGGALVEGGFAAAVARLGSDGTRDGGFGDGGAYTRAVGPGDLVTGLASRPNGAIVAVAGGSVLSATAGGDPDASFGTDGVTVVEPPPGYDVGGGAVVLQPDGKIVVATTVGESHPPIGFVGNVVLTRLDADGTFDASFGSGGSVSTVGGYERGLALQADGKILVAGATPQNIVFSGTVSVARHVGFTLPCPASPAPVCRGSVAASAGKLRMDRASDPKAKMQWAWQKGEATTLGDFGNPVGGDGYALCLYDESGTPTLVTGAVLPGGGTCKAGKPCWKALGTSGFAYGDGAGIRFGIQSVKLKAGVDGKAQVKIQGRGPTLPVPALPAPLPLRLQLIADGGQCWQSVFSAAGLHRNDAGRFQGTSD